MVATSLSNFQSSSKSAPALLIISAAASLAVASVANLAASAIYSGVPSVAALITHDIKNVT